MDKQVSPKMDRVETPPGNPLDRMNKSAAPAAGGLFKEVNELRTVQHDDLEDENAKYKDSFCGRLAGNKKFEALTFFFIGLNAAYIGLDADYSARTGKPDDLYDPKTPIWSVIMENVFCVYFTFEVLVRFIGYKEKRTSLTDGWFIFDGTLVTMMVLETWFFPMIGVGGALAQFAVLRLLRLLRISRMARLMKKVPELMIIIKGLIASFRSVGCTAILQVLILYVWSILFVSEYHEKYDELNPLSEEDPAAEINSFFGTMGKSMFSLFIYGTVLDDVTQCADAIRNTESMSMLALFIIFILISSFTILNMLIGILCEVVSATAESEQTKGAETCVKEAITTLYYTLDSNGDGMITEEEFKHMRDNEDVQSALEDMDIYDSHFQRYCEILFHKTDEEEASDGTLPSPASISFDKLITMILRLSPGNHINALDFSLLQASMSSTQENLRDRIVTMRKLIEAARKGGSGAASADFADTRKAALGDSPPGPPTNAFASEPVPAAQEYTMDMFVRTSSHEIIDELERRLGSTGGLGSQSFLAGSAGQVAHGGQEAAFNPPGVPDE